MAKEEKNILYLEIDDEITAVIDKLKNQPGSTISLVVPKRASLIQSIVNLKLLKREADKLKKEVAIVTTDKTGLALSRQVGFLVSESLDETPKLEPMVVHNYYDGKAEEKPRDELPVEKIEKAPVEESELPKGDQKEPITQQIAKKLPSVTLPSAGDLKKKLPGRFKDKKLLVAAGLVAILVLYGLFGLLLPRATVAIIQKGDYIPIETAFKAGSTTNLEKNQVASKVTTSEKQVSSKFSATGKKDAGTKASGEVALSNKTGLDQTLVAGTRLTAYNLIFKTESEVTIPKGSLDANGDTQPGIVSVKVTAENNGDQYNIGPTRFIIPAIAANLQSRIYGDSGSPMSGGSSKQINVVSSDDINSAKEELTAKVRDELRSRLKDKNKDGFLVESSVAEEIESINVSPSQDQEATQFELSGKVVSRGFLLNESDMKKFLEEKLKADLKDDQTIVDTGLDKSTIDTKGVNFAAGTADLSISSNGFVGKIIDKEAVKSAIKGMSRTDADKAIYQQFEVESVKIETSPFFVKKLPKLKSNIKVELKSGDK